MTLRTAKKNISHFFILSYVMKKNKNIYASRILSYAVMINPAFFSNLFQLINLGRKDPQC